MKNGKKPRDYYTEKELVEKVVKTVNSLPGGAFAADQKLSEPIKIIKQFYKDVEINDKLMGSEELPLDILRPVRRCRDCGTILDATRYWHCRKCVEHLPAETGYEIYCDIGEF